MNATTQLRVRLLALHQPANNCGKRARHKLVTFSVCLTSHGHSEGLENPLVRRRTRKGLVASCNVLAYLI